MNRFSRFLVSLVFVSMPAFMFLTGCQTVPYTGRSQLVMTSVQEEKQMGEEAWYEVQRTSKISTNQKYNLAVKRVGTSIAAVANKPDYEWEFKVFESDEPNAFCLPGGKIAVYTGLFKYAANDAELAAVVAHEVGHALARHGGERVSQAMLQQAGAQVVEASLDGKSAATVQAWTMAYGGGTNLGVMLPFSRTHEYEADNIGLTLMAKAGYNPEAAITFWNKFKEVSDTGTIGEFLSTHPMSEKRLEEMNKLLPKAMDTYRTLPVKKNLGEKY